MVDDITVSIVTVCLNAENDIVETIESVLDQSFQNFEYIIKDGGSSDKTNEIISSYKEIFESRNIPFHHIVSKDDGIYCAMNEALLECKGKWVNFMNSGDSFYNESVLESIFNNKNIDDYDAIYGDTYFLLHNHRHYVGLNNHLGLKKGTGIAQQVFFVRSYIFKNRKFNCDYRILADYDFFLYLLKENYKFFHLNMIIAKFNRKGISTLDVVNNKRELCNLFNEYKLCTLKMSKLQKLKNIIKAWITKRIPVISDIFMIINDTRRNFR